MDAFCMTVPWHGCERAVDNRSCWDREGIRKPSLFLGQLWRLSNKPSAWYRYQWPDYKNKLGVVFFPTEHFEYTLGSKSLLREVKKYYNSNSYVLTSSEMWISSQGLLDKKCRTINKIYQIVNYQWVYYVLAVNLIPILSIACAMAILPRLQFRASPIHQKLLQN